MAKNFSNPRGTDDILPQEVPLWQAVEQTARTLLNQYGYKEIRTPCFEETELFARSVGQSSDIVQKQMLNLAAQKPGEGEGLSGLTLRPEATAAVVRAYIQKSLDRKEGLSKLYYIGPMFRGERPQKGRLRQFHQVGVEAIGPDASSPYLDAEVIALSVKLLNNLGINGFQLKLNTLGSGEDKARFSKWLRKELKPHLSKFSSGLKESYEQNVFRILDSKEKGVQAVVEQLDIGDSHLSAESRAYFSEVCKALDQMNIGYEVSPQLVRGLDYYTHTVYEITESSLGSQDTVCAGGRYNNLVSQLGGPEVGAVGFALGIERLLLAMPAKAKEALSKAEALNAFLIALDEKSFTQAFQILDRLRGQGVAADISYRLSSMKSQMRLADKSGARYVIILGEDERKKGILRLKDMDSGQQEDVTASANDINSLIEKLSC